MEDKYSILDDKSKEFENLINVAIQNRADVILSNIFSPGSRMIPTSAVKEREAHRLLMTDYVIRALQNEKAKLYILNTQPIFITTTD